MKSNFSILFCKTQSSIVIVCFFTTFKLPENHTAEESSSPPSSKSIKVLESQSNKSEITIFFSVSGFKLIFTFYSSKLNLSGSKANIFPFTPTNFEKKTLNVPTFAPASIT